MTPFRVTTFKKRLVPEGRDVLHSDWFAYRDEDTGRPRRLVAAVAIPAGPLAKAQLQALDRIFIGGEA